MLDRCSVSNLAMTEISSYYASSWASLNVARLTSWIKFELFSKAFNPWFISRYLCVKKRLIEELFSSSLARPLPIRDLGNRNWIAHPVNLSRCLNYGPKLNLKESYLELYYCNRSNFSPGTFNWEIDYMSIEN